MGMLEIIEEVLAVQTLRARAYQELAQAMQANDTLAIVKATDAFRELSGRILVVIDMCNDGDGQLMTMGMLLREMQANESDKLRLTVEIQALKNSPILAEEDRGIGGEPTCGCGSRNGPTKSDVEEALREGYIAMEGCVQRILDCMQELREMRVDH